MWVLGTEPGSPAKAADALNYRTISPVLKAAFTRNKEALKERNLSDRTLTSLAITSRLSKWSGNQQHPLKPRSRCGHKDRTLGQRLSDQQLL